MGWREKPDALLRANALKNVGGGRVAKAPKRLSGAVKRRRRGLAAHKPGCEVCGMRMTTRRGTLRCPAGHAQRTGGG